jgi:catalase
MAKAAFPTTSAGNPVSDNQNSLTASPRGPLRVQD